ncbi:hypothetical protein NIES2100_15860 [Calothrix sp. NIES-2100]|uniref:hypothetical protein n=1 Tax=Calothrix sp. NIES-2100 TaxID=1954172 RepID=UPI000B617E1E|nr:hypothetical protein NIES2100_15860 [Calothrix sp. NIES-2100]
MLKILPYFGKFAIASTMLTQSLLIALSMNLDTAVLAQPTPAPIPTTPPINQPTNAIAQQLIGQWQSKDPSSELVLTFVFSPDGKLYILSPNSQKPMAVEFRYSIDPTPKPMHLDVIISKDQKKALTIFELTADGQLRLQLDNTDPGQPRPTAFSGTATLFTKVSDNPKVPENVKIIDLDL